MYNHKSLGTKDDKTGTGVLIKRLITMVSRQDRKQRTPAGVHRP